MSHFIGKTFPAIMLSTLALVGCGGGSSSSSSSEIQIAPAQNADRYNAKPDAANCISGQVKDIEKQNVLARVNKIRALHGLPPVTYNSAWDSDVANAALIMVANNTLNHHPDTTAACYTPNGASAAGTSNLYYVNNPAGTLAEDSTEGINFYLTDYYNEASNEPHLGHRLWILDPFVTQVAFGRVDGSPKGSGDHVMASALKIIGGPREVPATFASDYIAYPAGNYPSELVAKQFYLSFSVVADRQNSWNNGKKNVDYSASQVRVFDQNMQAMNVTEQAGEFVGSGIGNVIKWKVANLQDNQNYTVKITDVKVNGVYKTYDYSFKLVR